MGNPVIQGMGMLDLISALVLILIHFDIIGWKLGFVVALYLFIKAYAFKGDIASILDGVCGIYVLLVMFGLHTGFTYVVVFYFIQKAAISFM